MFAFGQGPGPKNVGIELDDGTRTVVAYRTYKFKYRDQIGGRLSDKTYATASGHVQFDPKTRDANGKQVVDIAIRAAGSQKLINITLWPEFQVPGIKKGDWISVDGSFEQRTYQAQDGSQRESLSISPFSLAVVPCVPRTERTVVQAAPAAATVVQAAPASAAVPF